MQTPEPDSPKRRPASTLVLLFVILYALGVVAYLAGRGFSVRSEDRLFPRADYAAEDLVPDPTEIPPLKGKRSPPVDLAAAARPSPASLSRGGVLYGQICASCHGPEGRGDGAAAAGLNPPPRDFTAAAGWKTGRRVSDIFRTLSRGVPGTSMAAYDYLPAEDRFALAHRVRTLASTPLPEDTPKTLASLDEEYSLSRGLVEPSRIPLSASLERLSAEFRHVSLAYPEARRGGRGEELFRLAVRDPAVAARTLLATEAWRGDVDDLTRLVTSGAPANGFSPSTATLTTQDWLLLQHVLDLALPRREG